MNNKKNARKNQDISATDDQSSSKYRFIITVLLIKDEFLANDGFFYLGDYMAS